MALFPGAAQIEQQTPPGRDRVIDLVRIASLLVVVTAHAAMAIVHFDGATGEVHLDNLLGVLPQLQPLTWALQVLPLFFFAGGAASALAWIGTRADGSPRRPDSWGGWLLTRIQRLYRPLAVYATCWAVALAVAAATLPPGIVGPLRGVATQLVWFLGVYVLVLAWVPLLARAASVPALSAVIGGLAATVAVVDAGRLGGWLPDAAGSLNFLLAWLVPAALGVGYVRGLLRPAACAVVAGVALAVDVALVASGPYEISLVTVPGQELSNMTPPSLLIVGHSLVLCCVLVVVRPALARLAARPRVWRWVAIGNSGAMTIYLWHLPCVVAVVAAWRALVPAEAPGDPHFWWVWAARLLCAYVMTAVIFLPLSAVENRRLWWWDGPVGAAPAWRTVPAGVLLVGSGVAVLLHAKWGMNGPGPAVLCGALAAAVAARALLWPEGPGAARPDAARPERSGGAV